MATGAAATSIDLSQPIDPTKPELATMLADLQGNILKGHGREHTVHILLRFTDGKRSEVKKLIETFADDYVTSALTQHQETDEFKKFGISGSVFGNFLLSKKGYEYLQATQSPDDPSFAGGMQGAALNDPPVSEWQRGLAGDLHAMLLLADDDEVYLQSKARDLMTQWRKVATICAVEVGSALRNKNDDPIEHFGYVDGRSQPLFYTTDIEHERTEQDGTTVWDPSAPLSLVLVPDPMGGPSSFGSYFVFRKLEQNVRGFKRREQELAEALGLEGKSEELAGAMVVGRFEDGTPVALQRAEGMHNPVPNNFNFAVDPSGSRCPFHAHIRKTNPRGDTVRLLGATDEQERSHRIARRGITYGRREKHPSDDPTLAEMPTGGVGLLFMCFQANLANQFEFMQSAWADNPSFVQGTTGIDPVIGQSAGPAAPNHWPLKWGDASRTQEFGFAGFVKMLGGEYFFAPSLTALKKF